MTSLPEIAWSGPALVYPMPARASVDTFDQFDFHVRRYLRSDHYRRAIATGGEVAALGVSAPTIHEDIRRLRAAGEDIPDRSRLRRRKGA